MAPNHIFVEKEVEKELTKELKKVIKEFYGNQPIKSVNLSKLESNQFTRTLKILKKYKTTKSILFGGFYSKKESKISPTILKIRTKDELIIKEELFSSLLPILPVKDYKSALNIIHKNSRPLAIYIFGGNRLIHKKISNLTSSGSICINDVLLPVLIPNLPFGGVGQSGMGKFHGEEGFKNFSNQKSITANSNLFDINLRYPPYEWIQKLIKFFFKI